jgi:hypothetical protein
VVGPRHRVAPGRVERGGEIEDHHEISERGLTHRRGPLRAISGYSAEQPPVRRPPLVDGPQAALPVGTVDQQQPAGRCSTVVGEPPGGARRQLGVGRPVAVEMPGDPGGERTGAGGPRPGRRHLDQRGAAQPRVRRHRGGTGAREDPGERRERDLGQLHGVLHVRDEPLPGRRQLDRGEQRQHLRLGGREPGRTDQRGEDRRAGQRGGEVLPRPLQVGAHPRTHRGHALRLGAVEAGQRGEDAVEVVLPDEQPGEVARRPALAQPADQGLALEQDVREDGPGLGGGRHRGGC